MIMEITLMIMEKSWENHGILFLNFCGNPVLHWYMVLVDLSPNTVSLLEWIMTGLLSASAGVHVFLDTTLVLC